MVEFMSTFFLYNSQPRHRLNYDAVTALVSCVRKDNAEDSEFSDWIPLPTGSVAELYLQPLISCIGDYDTMYYGSGDLAIPEGYPPPTQLPAEFDRVVFVHEIIDSEFPSYVYLIHAYTLAESDNGEYIAIKFPGELCQLYVSYKNIAGIEAHGPACATQWSHYVLPFVGRVTGYCYTIDDVPCMRCLSWPPQAADWPSRYRHCGWPDSATVDRVTSNGCDLVRVAHHRCRQDECESRIQHRLSFSRAEIVLVNSWLPVQQIVYHMLRIFVKIERLTDSSANAEAGMLSNYHMKTLMLWACELKTNSWWTVELNLIEICVELLQVLSVWLQDARCKHYFINNCNLLRRPDCVTATRLRSVKDERLAEWFINNYVHKYSEFCRYNILRKLWFYTDIRNNTTFIPQSAFALSNWRLNHSLLLSWDHFSSSQHHIANLVYACRSLSVRSCFHFISELAKVDQRLIIYFTAMELLNVAVKTSNGLLTEELLLALAAICYCVAQTPSTDEIQRCFYESLQKFTTEELAVTSRPTDERLLRLLQVKQTVFHNLNKTELVSLLQQSAVEYLTAFRRVEARDFGSVVTVVTTDFEALYAYKLGDYQHCLQLCTHNVRMLISAYIFSTICFFPLFIQLMDDDIVSLIGLVAIVDKSFTEDPLKRGIRVLSLSLYLLAQCQLKLRYSKTSLAQTLDYIVFASHKCSLAELLAVEQLVLKFAEQKILKYLTSTDT